MNYRSILEFVYKHKMDLINQYDDQLMLSTYDNGDNLCICDKDGKIIPEVEDIERDEICSDVMSVDLVINILERLCSDYYVEEINHWQEHYKNQMNQEDNTEDDYNETDREDTYNDDNYNDNNAINYNNNSNFQSTDSATNIIDIESIKNKNNQHINTQHINTQNVNHNINNAQFNNGMLQNAPQNIQKNSHNNITPITQHNTQNIDMPTKPVIRNMSINILNNATQVVSNKLLGRNIDKLVIRFYYDANICVCFSFRYSADKNFSFYNKHYFIDDVSKEQFKTNRDKSFYIDLNISLRSFLTYINKKNVTSSNLALNRNCVLLLQKEYGLH